jgi:hypothetical protein
MDNVLDVLDGRTVGEESKERVLVYARAGTGKSRFVLSVPEAWGKIVYYAADKNSWQLRSISAKKRERVIVVRPRGDDPLGLFMQFCSTDWKAEYPEAGVIVVDTYSKVAFDSISYTANTLTLDREKHYVVGEIGKGGIAIPNRGDYQGVDGLSKSYLDMLFDTQMDMHIIFVCHEESKEMVKDGPVVGGPQHPGRQMIDYLPAQFHTVVRLVREQVVLPGEDDVTSAVVAITENDGLFVAKLRSDDETAPNAMARRVLQRDPTHWWNELEAHQAAQVAHAEAVLAEADAPEASKKKKKKQVA